MGSNRRTFFKTLGAGAAGLTLKTATTSAAAGQTEKRTAKAGLEGPVLRVGDDMRGVGVPDPPDDQPGRDLLCLPAGSESGKRDLGDLGIGHPLPELFIEHRFRVADRGPSGIRDRVDGRGHGPVLAGGDGEPGPAAAGGGDHIPTVERTVRAEHHQPGAPARPGGDQGVGDQPGGTARRVRRPLPEPGRGDHRRRRWCRRDGQERIQTLHPGVPVPGALLGVAVGRANRVVDIDEGDLGGRREQRRIPGQAGQEPGRDRVQLPDMPELERAQERAQRRWCPHPGEQPGHRAVPEQSHVRDRISTRDHAPDQRGYLQPGRMAGAA